MRSHIRFCSVLLVILVLLGLSVTMGEAATLTKGNNNAQIDVWFNQTLAHANISQYEKDQIRQEYIYYQTAQNAIVAKQQVLAAHPVSPKSVENKRVVSAAFGIDLKNTAGSVPQGGIVQYTDKGKTRVYDAQNSELYVADDNESGTITTPSGAVIPKTHLISVPSGSSIYTIGNKDYITNKGTLILTVIHPETDAANTETDALIPSTAADSWVDWAQSSTGDIGLLSSTWKLPSNPDLDTDSTNQNSNLIWNGIQNPDASAILQPVTGFNYPHNTAIVWQNIWTGNVWYVWNKGDYWYTTQNPITLNSGDFIQGTVIKLPWENQWRVTLTDLNSGGNVQNVTSLSTSFPSTNVQAVNAFEAFPKYTYNNNLNKIYQYHWVPVLKRYTDSMKPSADVTFTNLVFNSNIRYTSLQWSENYNPLGHPTIKNLDMDITNLGIASIVQMHMNSASKPSHAIILTESPAGGGIISPNETINVPYDYSGTIPVTIAPNTGYLIDNVTVDGISHGAITSYTFPNDRQDHTLIANFKKIPTSVGWNWATDGWGDWQHNASWSGTQTGTNAEYGPVIVDGVGVHGTTTNLKWGSVQANVWKTFISTSGTGWNTLTFNGSLDPSDVPSGRWMTITVNGQQVFGATEVQTPPGNAGQPFTITASFPQTTTAQITISHGQNPAWHPTFLMRFYNLTLSNSNNQQASLTTKALVSSSASTFTIPDGSEWAGNNTTVTTTETATSVNSSG